LAITNQHCSAVSLR